MFEDRIDAGKQWAKAMQYRWAPQLDFLSDRVGAGSRLPTLGNLCRHSP